MYSIINGVKPKTWKPFYRHSRIQRCAPSRIFHRRLIIYLKKQLTISTAEEDRQAKEERFRPRKERKEFKKVARALSARANEFKGFQGSDNGIDCGGRAQLFCICAGCIYPAT